jgi:hypothetical protein
MEDWEKFSHLPIKLDIKNTAFVPTSTHIKLRRTKTGSSYMIPQFQEDLPQDSSQKISSQIQIM